MSTASSQLGRPSGANAAETRQRVIAATVRCIAEAGYAQASIRDIAAAAGMTSASLYHYFPTKAELFDATVTEIEQLVGPQLRQAAARADGIVERVEAVLDEADRVLREYPYLAAFDRAIRAESAAARRGGDPLRTGFSPLRAVFAEIVQDARAQQALTADSDAAGIVDALDALGRGLIERAAHLAPHAFHAALTAAKQLIAGTLLGPPA